MACRPPPHTHLEGDGRLCCCVTNAASGSSSSSWWNSSASALPSRTTLTWRQGKGGAGGGGGVRAHCPNLYYSIKQKRCRERKSVRFSVTLR